MIFGRRGFGQLDINNLLLLDRAWSLGRSCRCFSLNGSLYLGRSLGGLRGLGGFLRFLGGSGFLCRFILLAEPLSVRGEAVFPCLLWADPAFRGLGLFLTAWPWPPWTELGPLSGALPPAGRRLGSVAFFSAHDFRELKTDAGGLFLRTSAALSCGAFSSCAGLRPTRGWSLESRGCSALAELGRGLGPGRAVASGYDFCFSSGHSHFLPSYLMA